MSSVVPSKIPRPTTLKGAHERLLRRGLVMALSSAVVGAGIGAYFGIYKLYNWWTKSLGNIDRRERAKRIKGNEDVFLQKWEYWWRTGEWVGNGYVIPPPLPEGTAVGFHPRLFPKEGEPDPRSFKIEDSFDD